MSQKMDKPIPLITISGDKFVVNEESMKVLANIKGEIAVVSVAGVYRTGKSYVLNRLLGRQKGFDVGPTINPCTKGIYIWGEPVQLTKDGKKCNLLVIDTEGISSIQQDSTYDAKIFSLAILLSSYFIYNSMGTIDESALDKLSFIVNLTRQISVKDKNVAGESADLSQYFPHFLWLVRDFSLRLVDEHGTPITSTQYLENALRETPVKTTSQKEKNEVRHVLKTFFQTRDCLTLVRPTVDENDLQAIDEIPETKLRKEFVDQSHKMVQKIKDEVSWKSINGKALTGRGFAQLVKAYVEAINKGVPTIHTAWKSVAMLENAQAVETAYAAYAKAIHLQTNEKLPMNSDKLQEAHQTCMSAAFEKFKEMAYDEGDEKKKSRQQLSARIEREFSSINEKNKAASFQQAEQLLQTLAGPIKEALRNHKYTTMQALVDAWVAMTREYLKKATGSFQQVQDRLITYEQQNFGPMLVQLSGHFADQAKQALADQKQKEVELNHQLIATRKEVESAIQKASKHEVDAAKLKEKSESLDSRVKQLERERAELDKSSKAIEQQLRELSGDFQRMIIEKKDAENKLSNTEVKLAALVASSEAERKRLLEDKATLDASLKDVKGKHNQQKEHYSQSLSSFKSENQSLKDQVAILQSQLVDAKSSSENLTRSKGENEKELEKLKSLVKRLENDLTEEKSINKKHQQDVNSLRASSDIGKKHQTELEGEKKKLENTIAEHRKDLVQLEREHASTQTELKDVKSKLEDSKKAHDAVMRENAKLSKKLDEIQERSDGKESEVDELLARIKKLEADNLEAEQALEEAHNALEQAALDAVRAPARKAAEPKKVAQPKKAAVPAARTPVRGRGASISKATVGEEESDDEPEAVVEVSAVEEESAEDKENTDEDEPALKPAKNSARGARAAPAKKATSTRKVAPKRKRNEIEEDNEEDERVLVEANRPAEKRAKTVDPKATNKTELKKLLTAMGVKLPVKDMPKQTYVDLYLANTN